MISSLLIGGATCLCMICGILFFPQIRIGKYTLDSYWVVGLLGAAMMLATGQTTFASIGQALTDDSAINPLKILILFLSMTLLSIFLDEVGFFRYLASRALTVAGENQRKLFAVLYLTVSVLTVFTSNDIIVLTFTPFLCYFAKNAHISPKPYLVAEFVAANTMSMMLMIGNPTNIYIATSYEVGFVSYFLTMALPTLAASLAAFAMLWMLFRRELQKPMQAEPVREAVGDRLLLAIGLSVLSVCTVVLAVGAYIGIEMWLAALCAAVGLILTVGAICLWRREKPTVLMQTMKRAPWQLIPFVLSMFVIISALTGNGVTGWINRLLGGEQTVLRYGAASFFAANVINNIPMSVLFCPVISPLTGGSRTGAVFAAIIGSNLGAYLTPMGALAGIMWMAMLKKQKVAFGYGDFIKYGTAVALPTLAVCLGVLMLEF